ncbi:MAG: hypothetical protein Q9178_001659 [Gyalolechia marmorata]
MPQLDVHMITRDEGNLNILVQAYTPPFTRCERASPVRRPNHEACQTIINSMMKASTETTTFAAVGVPVQRGPVERLPQTLVARKICPSGCDKIGTCAYQNSRQLGVDVQSSSTLPRLKTHLHGIPFGPRQLL